MKTSVKLIALGVTAAFVGTATMVPVWAKSKMETRFEKVDSNGDGFLDAAEIQASRDAKFAEIDTNDDGALDEAEMTAHREKWEAKRKDRAEKRRAKMMAKADTNGDGLLQKEEMTGKVVERMMERLDKDGDGRISKDEMKAMRGKFRKHEE